MGSSPTPTSEIETAFSHVTGEGGHGMLLAFGQYSPIDPHKGAERDGGILILIRAWGFKRTQHARSIG